MLKLKLLIFILLFAIFGSCYDINDTCNDNGFLERINAPPGNIGISSIAVASNGDIWCVTANGFENYNIAQKVYLSTNNGDIWVQKGSFPLGPTYSMEVSPINGYIFIGFDQGLFRSADRGNTWVEVTGYRVAFDILIKPSGEIYFTTQNNIYYSSDNGDTWIEKNNGLPLNYITALTLGKDGMLYAGTWHFGVYRSTDGGDIWLPSSNYNDDTHIYDLTTSNDGSIFAVSEYRGILKSIDKGVTWTQLNSKVSAYGRIIYNTITEDIFVSYDDGIYRSTDKGVTWTNILPNTIDVFAFNPNTGQMYLGGNGGFYRFTK